MVQVTITFCLEYKIFRNCKFSGSGENWTLYNCTFGTAKTIYKEDSLDILCFPASLEKPNELPGLSGSS